MRGPLDGVKVIDVSAVISGPMACQVLADQGAEVIKVEPVVLGDITRAGGFRVGDVSSMFASVNRGKPSVALDLSKREGVEVFTRLAADADVLVQNFRPGAVERMGIGPEALLERNPELIYVSISGYGPSGPYRSGRVYDPIIQSLAGLVSTQRSPEAAMPDLVRTLVCDKTTALTVAGAVSAALYARAVGHARGQHVEVPMLDAALYWLWPDTFMGHTFEGEDVVPGPLLHQIYRLSPTSDGHVVCIAVSDKETHGLFRALGHPEWVDDPRFASPQSRLVMDNFQAMMKMTAEAFLALTTDQAIERLTEEEVPAARVNAIDDVFEDVQVLHNEAIRCWQDPRVGAVRMAKPPVRFGATPSEPRWSFDSLGESTERVLREHGYGDAALEKLRAERVILA